MKNIILIVLFTIVYSIFVFKVNFSLDNYSDIIVGTTFFFTLFISFFMTRQNERYSQVNDLLTSSDGYFSYLYRVTGIVPRIQSEVREIIREHYQKIIESGNFAYHVLNPSNTLTRLTKSISSLTEAEDNTPSVKASLSFSFEVLANLQVFRKKILNLYQEKLVPFQWEIIYVLALILIVSFNFVPSTSIIIDILKVCFGVAVFISIILLHQLNDLTLFGSKAGMKSVEDVLRILDEKDSKDLSA